MTKLLSFLIIFFTLLSNTLFAEDWPMLNSNLTAELPIITKEFNFSIIKKNSIGRFYNKKRDIANVVLVEDKAYLLDKNNTIVQLDLKTNKKNMFYLPSDYKNLTPKGISYHNGSLFISFAEGIVVSYSLDSKTVLWDKNLLLSIISAPIIDGNSLILVSNINVINIDVTTGENIWSTPISNTNLQVDNIFSPTIFGNYIYLGTSNSNVLILNKATGEIINNYSVATREIFNLRQNGTTADIKAPIKMIGKETLLILYQNKVVAYNILKNSIVWQQNIQGSYFAPNIIDENNIIVSSINNELYSIDGITGNINWKTQLIGSKKPKVGILIWYYPVIVNDKILLINSMGEIQTFDKANGILLDTYKTYSSEVETTAVQPIITNDNILLLTSYGNLYSIKAE